MCLLNCALLLGDSFEHLHPLFVTLAMLDILYCAASGILVCV